MAGGVLYILLRAVGSSLLAAPSANLAGGGTLVAVTIWVWLMGAVDDVLFVCGTLGGLDLYVREFQATPAEGRRIAT